MKKITFKDQTYDNFHDLFARMEMEGYLQVTRLKIYKAEDQLVGTSDENTNEQILEKLLKIFPDELIEEKEE